MSSGWGTGGGGAEGVCHLTALTEHKGLAEGEIKWLPMNPSQRNQQFLIAYDFQRLTSDG